MILWIVDVEGIVVYVEKMVFGIVVGCEDLFGGYVVG